VTDDLSLIQQVLVRYANAIDELDNRTFTWLAPTILVAATILTRWPWRGRTLFNWDAIQYALAMDRFDLAAHRPHPPGYPGYVLAGRALRGLTGLDANTSLIVLSIGATAAGAIALARIGGQIATRRTGLIAAALLLASPLAWLYSDTALTYAFDPLISLTGGWFAWRALRHDSAWTLVRGGLLVGVLGAVRPTSSALLLPLLVWTGWRLWRRGAARPAALAAAATAVVVGTASWAVPLVIVSGGPVPFIRTSLELGDAVSASSAVWSTGLSGLLANSGAVLDGLLLSLGLALPLLIAAALSWWLTPRRQRAPAPWPGPGPGFIAAWIGPALLVFSAIHIGQLGYLLFPLPALLLPAAAVVERSPAWFGLRSGVLDRRWPIVVVLGANLVIFAAALAPVIRRHDREVATVLATVRALPPGRTVVLTDPASDGSYRLGLYSLRPYRVLAVGQDRRGVTGELFASDGSAPEYDLRRFDRAGPLRLPSRGDLVALDGAVLRVVGDPAAFDDRHLADAARIWRVTLDPAAPPLLWGQRIWVRGGDCPCQRYRHNAPHAVHAG